jgi:HD-GYP domain-containing protein (c-di-GMP phosphodiesterase class II)
MKVRYDIRTLDGKLLLGAGSAADSGNLEELAAVGAGAGWPVVPLLEYGSIHGDLQHYMGLGPYRRIFADPPTAEAVGRLMEPVGLPLPVLEALDSFRTGDFYTYRHILMVFALSCLLAHDLRDELRRAPLEAAAGPLHDLGKICVPLPILIKSSPLQRSERHLLEHHTAAGYVLIAYYLGDAGAFTARVARDHHERRDGSGYPRGVSLEDRHVEIVSVCDIYDALIMPRPYRKGSYDNRTALEELTSLAEEGKVSRDIVRRLIAFNRTNCWDSRECVVSLEKRGTPPRSNNYGIILDDEEGEGG